MCLKGMLCYCLVNCMDIYIDLSCKNCYSAVLIFSIFDIDAYFFNTEYLELEQSGCGRMRWIKGIKITKFLFPPIAPKIIDIH